MKKSMKKILCTLLIMVMCLASVPLSGFVGLDLQLFSKVAAADELAATGTCGKNVNYSYNSSTGELFISGTGEMNDYGYYDSPFSGSDIKSVVIENGVTSIGRYAFLECYSLTSVTIPGSVKKYVATLSATVNLSKLLISQVA